MLDRSRAASWLAAWGGALLVSLGAGGLGAAVWFAHAGAHAGPLFALSTFGWSAGVYLLRALTVPTLIQGMAESHLWGPRWPLVAGALLWAAGWALLAAGTQRLRRPQPPMDPSAAVGAKLYPPLARYRDFYWSTLLAYGGGMALAELTLVVLQTALASSRKGVGAGPVTAFVVSLLAASGVAFVAGFLGSARAQRLAAPEATLGLMYFGLPLPLLLTALPYVPALEVSVAPRLREVTYLANLLGRPELGYWLVYFLLVITMLLGMTSGFVATGSGKVSLRAGFELFVARRHVSIFRPKLLLGTLLVLVLFVVPPLIIFAILRATEAAVDRTRIRALGLKDPLSAARALHEARLKEQSPTAMMTALSVGGVGVGVMALIVVLSVMSGFEEDLQRKILGSNAHGVVTTYDGPMAHYGEVMAKVAQVPGVVGQTPFTVNEVMISSERNVAGTVVKGIDPGTVGQVVDLPKDIRTGSMEYLLHPDTIPEDLYGSSGQDTRISPPPRRTGSPVSPKDPSGPSMNARHPAASLASPQEPDADDGEDDIIQRPKPTGKKAKPLPGIILGSELAANLRVVLGDTVRIISPLGGEMGPQGPTPKFRVFRLAGIFYSGMFEYDAKFAYILLAEAQTFFDIKGAMGLELKVSDIGDAKRICENVERALDGYPFKVRDWGEMNKNLFSALRLEKLVMAIILSMIVIVAAGLIVATVIMLILEKRKEIAVLKALGVPDAGIVKIFLAEGLQIGVAGGLLGLASGLLLCLFIEKVGLRLDPEVYYISELPVKIEPLQTALAVLVAVLVTYLTSIYPALKASRVEPVEGLKAE